MNAQDFAYWLQGFSELNDGPPSPEQWQSIRGHLALVFNKVTPAVGIPLNPLKWKPGPAGTPLQPLRAECSVQPAIAQTYC